MWTVYILKCSDGTYVGCTENFKDRKLRHNRGDVKYTSTRLPFEIAHQSIFSDKYKAFEFEIYLKSGQEELLQKSDCIQYKNPTSSPQTPKNTSLPSHANLLPYNEFHFPQQYQLQLKMESLDLHIRYFQFCLMCLE